MLKNDINITVISVGKNILPKFNTAIISKAIVGDLKKHFYHELLESFPDDRLIFLERRRATLSRQCKYKISKCSEFNLHLAKDKEKLLLKVYNGMYLCSTSCMCIKSIVFELLNCGLNEIV